MLRNSDIIHSGLKDIHANGTTHSSAPPVTLVRHCDRRLQALGRARSIPSRSFFGIVIQEQQPTSSNNQPAYDMPIGNNKIKFQWDANYALQVDWV
jgi:hypothetical protein